LTTEEEAQSDELANLERTHDSLGRELKRLGGPFHKTVTDGHTRRSNMIGDSDKMIQVRPEGW